jgi:hypothetical protein
MLRNSLIGGEIGLLASAIITLVRPTIVLTLVLVAALASSVLAGEEACRIRVHNEVNGLVQVSLDAGRNWSAVGRVRSPANARIVGFVAASYVPHGTIAATAVHGLRIKTGQYSLGVGKAQKAMLFSIEPLEFARIPNGFGGHQPRSSGVYTDIFAGHSIFRNDSPYVGNAVYVERDHKLQVVPLDYTPIEGETFVIVVIRPDKPISSIEFENNAQGKVTVRYPDGSGEVIASVDRPVKGTGRYDGTTFTGVGAINTNHGGVLTISTAPTCPPMIQEGASPETRGGFMVQPYFHATEQGEQSPQVMVVGPIGQGQHVPAHPVGVPAHPVVEGTPPLFFGNINLTRYWGDPEHSFRAQIKIDDGPWEDVPQIIGKVDNAFTAEYLNTYFAAKGSARKVTQGVTAVRLLFPKYDSALLAHALAQEAEDYTKRVTGIAAVKGMFTVRPSRSIRGAGLVSFYLDGYLVSTDSADRATWYWDTTKAANGLHEIEIETEGVSGAEKRVVLVRNTQKPLF